MTQPVAPVPRRALEIELTVNGEPVRRQVEARMTLADFLRHELGLTGTHVGCEHGVCGACTVLVDAHATRSCILYAVQAHASRVDTVESLAEGDVLHPLQTAFGEHGALQCGFCTPGILMSALDLLSRIPDPSETQVREALSGSICRCTGYQPIVDAVMSAAATMARSKT
jgi:carbon-monoxide dehydrogenase small subunit